MPTPIRSLAVLAAALLLTAATCGRPVVVESEGAAAVGASYRLEVVNATARDLSITYGPPGSPTLLGTVGANQRESFIILSPPSLTIRVVGRAEGAEPIERVILLEEGTTVTVTLD